MRTASTLAAAWRILPLSATGSNPASRPANRSDKIDTDCSEVKVQRTTHSRRIKEIDKVNALKHDGADLNLDALLGVCLR